ncbi:MAG: hypothetical protein JST26_06910 [Bacteroidetes bacterium]|nr:hypothetical protein [Bacteroidota bacterium]
MKPIYFFLFTASLFLSACKGCKKDKPAEEPVATEDPIPNENTFIKGYNILSKLTGIWNGPVSSTTPLGGYPEWIVDFRPVSAAQMCGKSELDTANSIFMSFFVVKNGNDYVMAFRNGGTFSSMQRVSYAVIDSVSETANQSFYRFVDFKAGKNRVYSDICFRSDSLLMKVYTNHYNTQSSPTIHMNWQAKLQDLSSAAPAVSAFSFPKKQMVKDFTSTFNSVTEAIYYNNPTADPYNEASQPYLGKTTVNVSFGGGLTAPAGKNNTLIITTQPLFSGMTFNPAQMKYRSRYVILSSTNPQFTFNYMHPGTYYLYAFCDKDGNGTYSSGDYMSSNLSNTFTLSATGQTTVNSVIDFTIP